MNPIKLSAEDKRLIFEIQGDLPISPTPFATLAQKAGLEEKNFLERVHRLMRR